MGVLLSSLCTRCINLWSRLSKWLPYRPWWAPYQKPSRDVEKGERKAHVPTPYRRALLVGISYHDSRDSMWAPLDNPHIDVDHFRNLLIQIYGYSPEDIVILKDDPRFPDHLQPTRANMIRELKRLVFGAARGDRFTFLYTGHSDLQTSSDDVRDEDGYDCKAVIITCDLKRIVQSELKYTLVKGLPVGCSLLAIFDTSYSGAMLNLPHYLCNNVYVPWISKGNRRTKTMWNNIGRGNAFDLAGLSGSASEQPTSVARISTHYWLSDTCTSSPLRINTEVGSVLSANQSKMSVTAGPWGDTSVLTPTRCESPVSTVKCDGWCRYDLTPRAAVVSLSPCGGLQRSWDGPLGSLTSVLCEFLKMQPLPSYRTLMIHVNFQLHAQLRALHEYTLKEKKKAARGEGPGFDGELNDFQAPQLNSLTKLNMDEILRL